MSKQQEEAIKVIANQMGHFIKKLHESGYPDEAQFGEFPIFLHAEGKEPEGDGDGMSSQPSHGQS